MYSPSIQNLIEKLSKFPTVGPRTAARFVFYLMKLDKIKTKELIEALADLKNNVKICRLCFNAFETNKEICPICSDSKRDKTALCIVANETDLIAIEKTKTYKGLYFILGGTVSNLKKESVQNLRISELETRIKNNSLLKEIILAINPTSDGQTTTLYLAKILQPFDKKITKLGLGIPIGGELEYADEETLSSALEGRK